MSLFTKRNEQSYEFINKTLLTVSTSSVNRKVEECYPQTLKRTKTLHKHFDSQTEEERLAKNLEIQAAKNIVERAEAIGIDKTPTLSQLRDHRQFFELPITIEQYRSAKEFLILEGIR